MLRIKQSHEDQYKTRWQQLEGRMIASPKFRANTPLQILNRAELNELSFAFFVGWLFTSVLNQTGEEQSCVILPADKGNRSVLTLYSPKSRLAIPLNPKKSSTLPQYFECPLDRLGRDLTDTERHLCPVVNRIRYNLSHARTDHSVEGFKEPSKTADCCASKKQALWDYLNTTLISQPETYGSIVGGIAFPINLEFDLLNKYLEGMRPTTDDFGVLLEETLLWYAMESSGVLIGTPHCSIIRGSTESYEIDMLLYATPESKRKPVDDIPQDKVAEYLADQSILILELTVGHLPESKSKRKQRDDNNDSETDPDSYFAKGKDRASNKLLNYLALKGFGFKNVETCYLSIIGGSINEVTTMALTSTEGFNYKCLSDILGVDIREKIIFHSDIPIVVDEVRAWYAQVLELIDNASSEFKSKLTQN